MTDADVLGVPRPFTWKGRTFQVCPRDLEMQLLFSNYVRGLAAADIRSFRGQLGEEAYQEALGRWVQDGPRGTYRFGGQICHEALFYNPDATRQMLFLKLAKGAAQHGGAPVDRQLLDRIAEDTEAWDALVQIMLEQDYPNPQKPAQQQAPAGTQREAEKG